jgi:5,5'-dehydrodivanillate O-demethylase
MDTQHTGPGTLAGRYLRMFWQPVYLARQLAPGRAKPIRILSEEFTLYRGESGIPHCLAFRCAHRGTQLSTGWVEGDELRCFYHGWKYGPDGQCVEQPAEPEPFCQRIRIRSYPTEEYLGLIFVYFGEGDPPPLPRYPDFEREAGRTANMYLRPCNFFQNLDNDGIHIFFVHRRPGNDFAEWNGKVPSLGVHGEDEFGIVSKGRSGSNLTHRGMPTLRIRKQTPGNHPRAEDSLAWHVPIDDERHWAVQVDISHNPEAVERATDSAEWMDPNELADEILDGRLGSDAVDMRLPTVRVKDAVLHLPDGRITDIVKVQDCVSQVGQGRIADRSEEHLGKTDESVILFRKIWERELRALHEGRPLKRWYRPESHMTGL